MPVIASGHASRIVNATKARRAGRSWRRTTEPRRADDEVDQLDPDKGSDHAAGAVDEEVATQHGRGGGVRFRAASAAAMLRRNLLIYGAGGVIAPFVGIKLIDLVVGASGIV